MSILIKNGTVVNSAGTIPAKLLTDEGSISLIGHLNGDTGAGKVIDATGMYILPGGVDPHVHMHLPAAVAGYSSDDFLTGSRAALFGGTTTIIDFVTPNRGEPLPTHCRRECARQKTQLQTMPSTSLLLNGEKDRG